MAAQNRTRSSRQASVGRPGEGICPRYNWTCRCRSRIVINHTSTEEVLRRFPEPEQFTSGEFARFCQANGIRTSTGRTGVCWDNAAAESFFAALKNEMYYRQAFPSRARARFAVAGYIEVSCNRIRLHSTLGYRTPAEVLTELQNAATAA